jgi:hypothetical protein
VQASATRRRLIAARKPQRQHVSWAIFRAAKKAVWVGEVEATDERDAIEKAAVEFKQRAAKLIAVKRT